VCDAGGGPVPGVSAGGLLATAATPCAELSVGDLSKQTWRVESRSDTEVRFVWESQSVAVHKTYSFSADGYDFRLRIDVSNRGQAAIAPGFLVEMPLLPRSGN